MFKLADIQQFVEFSDLFIQDIDAGVELLIGIDNRYILQPLKLINSDLGHNAERTVAGWVVQFILLICKTKVDTGGKRRKTLPLSKSAAPSINNLKRFPFSGISLEVKYSTKKDTHVQQKQSYRNECTKEAELHKHNYS